VEAQDHYEPTGVFSLPAYSARVPYFYTPSCGGLVTAFLKFKKKWFGVQLVLEIGIPSAGT